MIMDLVPRQKVPGYISFICSNYLHRPIYRKRGRTKSGIERWKKVKTDTDVTQTMDRKERKEVYCILHIHFIF